MKTIILFFFLLTITAQLSAQQTRTETVFPASPENDSRLNSDAVPSAQIIDGQFDRIVVVRLKHQTDILAGLDSAARCENIKNAAILFAIGSVRNYHYHVVSNRTFPCKNIFVKDPTDPADLLNLNGYIINGRIHAHITLSDDEKAFGGHLEPGTNVFTFVIVTIGVFKEGTDLSRVDDMTYR